ncbi:peptide/nickel transport system substrate-binding protein [Geodermatophilus tzadiensis]|uniref:Peptide/nickel transport system substrate-binding protein n=1 Tax=Geodermatophilus tzadiensis TaxID=1137988 RepID=A0A2T0TVE9_9ACTN|nr:ABC transporter substrate-binding protein [Geodermatophilus tzadiensis]PRY49672.1 peptide/nickel transport system substrate-binding protein [Geodermatophilus tzadiensis]
MDSTQQGPTRSRSGRRLPAWLRGAPGRVLGLAVVVVLVVVLAVSCGGGRESATAVPVLGDGPDAGVEGVRAASERTGGTLRVVTGDVDSLDPQVSYQPGVWNLMRLYTRTLVTYSSEPGRTAELVPDLATDTGTTQDGGLTWTFTLREGARFENGRAITSRDVKYGIERSFASDVVVGGPTYAVGLLDDRANPYPGPYQDEDPARLGLASVQTPDDLTIVFRLRYAEPDFPHVLALPASSPVPAENDTGAGYGADPVSSGPYAVTTVDPETGIVLDRNPQWDRASDGLRTALPDRVVVRTGLSQLERDQMLLAGSADVDVSGAGVHPATSSRLAEGGGEVPLADRVDDVTSGAVRMLALPTDVAPMDDPGCRAAVAAAVDRGAVQEAVGGADNAVRTSQLWPRAIAGGPEDPDPGPDPGAARAALAACGRPDGFSTVLAVPDAQASIDVAEEIADQLGAVGIEVDVRPLPAASFYATDVGSPDNVARNGFGVVLVTWRAGLPTPGSFLVPLADGRSVTDPGNTNYARLTDPALSGLVDTARAAPDAGAAVSGWRELATAARATDAYVPLVEARVQLLAGQRLHNGVVMQPYAGYDLATAGVR